MTTPLSLPSLSLLDALLAPWVFAGVPTGTLRALTQELRDKLGPLASSAGEPTFTVDVAIEAVEQLRGEAGIDLRDSLEDQAALPADLRNAAGHGLRLARAWCARHGQVPLPEKAAAHFLKKATAQVLGVTSAEGWAEHLVSSRAVHIPVDGRFGPRLLRLVPGAVDDLSADAWVVSGAPILPPRSEFTGGAYRAVAGRFGAVDSQWQRVLFTGPDSGYWPASVEDRSAREGYAGFYAQCGVWHAENPWRGGAGALACRHLVYVRTVPLKDARLGEAPAKVAVRAMLRALFASLGAIGATCEGQPPVTVRMTLVGGRQLDRGTTEQQALARQEHMNHLVTEACELLERSPVVQRLDICFFDESERDWMDVGTTWQRVLEERTQSARQQETADEAADLLRARCARAAAELLSARGLDPLVKEALTGLRDCLERVPRPASRELGFNARRTVEALVAGLCRKYNQKPAEVLEKNIEILRERGKFSRWFLSYLQTLRVLGNEAVHVSAKYATPGSLVPADETVLLASLVRVLTISREAPP